MLLKCYIYKHSHQHLLTFTNICGVVWFEKIGCLHILVKTGNRNEASMGAYSGSNFGAWTFFVYKYLVKIIVTI